jgi:histidinol-phosphate aminotransferase
MIFVPNPLANIGELIDKNKLIKIAKSLPETLIVIDEAYIEFCSLQASILAELERYENLIVLRTFSKFFGLAGIRLGFIFTNFSDEILKIKSPYNINMLTCQSGINVFENITVDIINKRQNEISRKRNELENWLKQFEEVETIFKSNTNFRIFILNSF